MPEPLKPDEPSPVAEKGYTLIIDNYDSFTWNVYADVAVMKGNPLVRRNDKITIEDVEVS
jgi:anthranilate/para-aminobenzoate synthase component II